MVARMRPGQARQAMLPQPASCNHETAPDMTHPTRVFAITSPGRSGSGLSAAPGEAAAIRRGHAGGAM